MSKAKRPLNADVDDALQPARPPAADAACAEGTLGEETPDAGRIGKETKGTGQVVIRVPLGPEPSPADYLSNHLEVRLLTPAQRLGLRLLCRGVDAAGLRLANGKRPSRAGDSIRWLLEQIAAAGDISGRSGAGTGDAA